MNKLERDDLPLGGVEQGGMEIDESAAADVDTRAASTATQIYEAVSGRKYSGSDDVRLRRGPSVKGRLASPVQGADADDWRQAGTWE